MRTPSPVSLGVLRLALGQPREVARFAHRQRWQVEDQNVCVSGEVGPVRASEMERSTCMDRATACRNRTWYSRIYIESFEAFQRMHTAIPVR
jgi:hypothetical protein